VIMGFDTHMILEAVPAPHSNRSDAHPDINRTPRHYAGALLRLGPDCGHRLATIPRGQVVAAGGCTTERKR